MAYVAITCLMNTIQQSIQLTGCNLQSSYKTLQSLRAIVEFPCSSVILGDIEALTRLEAQITRLTYTTEDKVDLESRNVFLAKNQISRRIAIWKLRFLLKQEVHRVDSSMKQWIGMIIRYTNSKDLTARNLTLVGTSQHALETENMMVGHENEFEMIQDQLTRGESEVEVVSIVATVSQEYRANNVLLGILSSISGKTDEFHEQQDDGQLADKLQKLLKVIDDIWTTGAWEDIKSCFPDCNCGSRILLTIRNVEVAGYASSGKPPYHMCLMNFDESWNLLHRKVFEKECSSPEFEKFGKQIAFKCGGLPLAITVIAGLLSKIGKTLDEWQSVSENVSSVDELIFVDKIVELWAVEGFLKNHEPTEKSTLVLKNLECLSGWNPWYCTSSDLRLFPKLKKLQICGVQEDFCSRKDLYDFRYLDQLEELEFRLSYTLASCFLESITPSGPLRFQREARHCGDPVPPLLLSPLDAFPQNLKKLIFSGHFFMPWKDFSIVGKLPKLESLKLSYTFFIDGEWEVSGEGFPYLKFVPLEYLNIRYWKASSDHFPCLERLFLEGCLCLDSIPQNFADITTFALIDICRCAQSVGNSAKQIQ
ncbi:hypothetical protein MTR67_038605 [Solanum verrucosum]|uniref:NB-ARC domain-containing protein n=1 Tax=Solanum verrucosum TaxID=315347 RepID=A0AAF0UFH3_SOLVR|nr:hypothetical protein MTR67_038605 [Solanum verrucosum]